MPRIWVILIRYDNSLEAEHIHRNRFYHSERMAYRQMLLSARWVSNAAMRVVEYGPVAP